MSKAKKDDGPAVIKWKKPTGKMIETNDLPDTIVAAMKLGWERQGDKK